MGLFRPDRDRQPGEDSLLIWKVRLFVVGGGLGIGGMMMELPWVLWSGVAILATGWLMRFKTGEGATADEAWGVEDGAEDHS